jgi:hypothetical protein
MQRVGEYPIMGCSGFFSELGEGRDSRSSATVYSSITVIIASYATKASSYCLGQLQVIVEHMWTQSSLLHASCTIC